MKPLKSKLPVVEEWRLRSELISQGKNSMDGRDSRYAHGLIAASFMASCFRLEGSAPFEAFSLA
jgi:hypothetical protein